MADTADHSSELAPSLGEPLTNLSAAHETGTRAAREDAEAAEAAEHYVSGILSAITDPFVVYDREWRFLYINAAAELAQKLEALWEWLQEDASKRVAAE